MSVNPERSESGAILVLTAALLLVLIGFAALAVDLGNAWSSDRFTQTSADLAALSALQEVPHTYRAGTPAALSGQPNAEAETDAAANALTTINLPDATVGPVTLSPDYLDVTVDLSLPVDTGFARAIGVSTVTVGADAEGHIEINEPSVDLMPLGFDSLGGTPYRCLAIDPLLCTHSGATPSPSLDITMLGQRRSDTTTPCVDADETMIANFRSGADHLVDLWSTGSRDEKLVCDDGHATTMPTTSQVLPVSRLGGIAESGIGSTGGRLAGDGAELWDFLQAGLAPPCDAAAIDALAPDLEAQASEMANCLTSGFAAFTPALNGEVRLTWGIDTAAGGSGAVYSAYTPIWLHHVIDATGAEFMVPPATGISGVAVFILNTSMLATPLEYDPGGIDNLDFSLNS